jgi:C1A family cysteine protease
MIEFRAIPKLRVMPRLGWFPDPPSSADWQLSSTILATTGTIVSEVDLSPYFKAVSDQFQFSSCTANAIADSWEAQTIMAKVATGTAITVAVANTPDLSRMFCWWNGRNAMYPSQTNRDTGCYLRLVMDSVARFGLCTEVRWPYTAENVSRRPSLMAYREAAQHRCDAFYAISEIGPERIQLLLRALSNRKAIAFGTTIDKAFFGLEPVDVWTQTGETVGGHAMAIVGYSLARHAFKVRNSWSEYWCDGGYCWISEAHMQSVAAGSFWIPTRGVL